MLAVLLAISVLIIIAALVIDRMNTDIGFFWVDGHSNNFGSILLGLLLIIGVATAIAFPIAHRLRSRKGNAEQKQSA